MSYGQRTFISTAFDYRLFIKNNLMEMQFFLHDVSATKNSDETQMDGKHTLARKKTECEMLAWAKVERSKSPLRKTQTRFRQAV